MKLKDYIQKVLEESEPREIRFEINLTADVRVADCETGNKVTFTVIKA